ncbi:hypothetical protein XENOCAPTIV_011189, partial [Xenoophorus captivus]
MPKSSEQDSYLVLENYIGGMFVSCRNYIDSYNPSTGKTVTFARAVDIPRSAQNFRFFASSVLHHTTECSQMDHMGCLNYTVR